MYQNPKLSKKSNQIIARRRVVVSLQKKFIFLAILLCVSALILLGSTIRTFAKSKNDNRNLVTDYSSIQIEKGDSLWSIAETYTNTYDVSINDYIEEVKQINHLESDDIHSGQYIIIPCYHFE